MEATEPWSQAAAVQNNTADLLRTRLMLVSKLADS